MTVAKSHRAVLCDLCNKRYHIKCANLSGDQYKLIQNQSEPWYCDDCKKLNECSIINKVLQPRPPPNTKQPKDRNMRPRKSILVNCDGLYNKIPHLEAMIDDHKPDVIIGTESHLKPDILNSEVTPIGFTTYRKDRTCARKGGVFIMIRDTFIATECSICTSQTELMWISLQIQGFKPLLMGVFYRPPNSDRENLQHLSESLQCISSSMRNSTILVAGDFNLPHVDWSNRTVKPYANEGRKCSCLLDIIMQRLLLGADGQRAYQNSRRYREHH